MNAKQKAYTEAKAIYDATEQAYEAEMATIEHLLDDDVEAWSAQADAIGKAHDNQAQFDALRMAEDELIEWAIAQAEKLAFVEAKSAISVIRANLHNPQHIARIRTPLIESAMKLI